MPADPLHELQRIARFTAQELRARVRAGPSRSEQSLLVLGDFNIDKRQGNPLFDAFVETGLWVPVPLQEYARPPARWPGTTTRSLGSRARTSA